MDRAESGFPELMVAATGTAAFAAFWLMLITIALLEIVSPGRKQQAALAPRLKVNFTLGIVAAVIGALPFLSAVAAAELARQQGWGLLNVVSPGQMVAGLISFLAIDLVIYGWHRISHASPLLWRLHRVHHADPDVDLSTLFRVHPAAALLGSMVRIGAIVAGGLTPEGIVVHGLAATAVMGLGHANIAAAPRLSRALSAVLVTPAFHAIHHSAERHETDSNFGEVFSVWDRLFGSVSRSSGPVARFGLGERYDPDAGELIAQLKLPLAAI